MNFRTLITLNLVIIISSELIYPQCLEHYDFYFNIREKMELILKLGIKTEIEIEKLTKTKSSDTSTVIRKFYYDKKGNLARYEDYKDVLGYIPTSCCDFYKDEYRNTLEVFVKGKLIAKREYDEEGNKTLEININNNVIDTVEQSEYNYEEVKDEKLLTSITELRKNFSTENCKKYTFDYDSAGRIIYRRDYWSNENLSMEKHWDYDSLSGYTKTFTSDGVLMSSSIHKFDENGNIIETKTYHPDINSSDTFVSQYNKKGKLVSSIIYYKGHHYKTEPKYDDNGNSLESKLFENEILRSCETSTYYNNELPEQRISEDFKTGRKIIKNFIYELY